METLELLCGEINKLNQFIWFCELPLNHERREHFSQTSFFAQMHHFDLIFKEASKSAPCTWVVKREK